MVFFTHQRRMFWHAAIMAMLFAALLGLPTGSQAQAPGDSDIRGDLGDAPDSTNHAAGTSMNAYLGVTAHFPTVYDPATGLPPGPVHLRPKADAWLGASVSGETDADLTPDADGVSNLIPPINHSNMDQHENGVFPVNPGGGITLPPCQQTQFNYVVSGAAAVVPHAATVNVWFDWNRNGSWGDILTCATSTGAVVTVPEWAVQNQVVAVNPGPTIVATPPFVSAHPASKEDMWMRITLGAGPAPKPPIGPADGRGPLGGYPFGETEDYRLYFDHSQKVTQQAVQSEHTMYPDVGYYSGN